MLDEATAHIDPATERRVLDGIRAWRAGRTTVHIAHHAAALADADLVLRVEHGRVVDDTRSPGGPQAHGAPADVAQAGVAQAGGAQAGGAPGA